MTALEVCLITIATIQGVMTFVMILMRRDIKKVLKLDGRVFRLEQDIPHDFSGTVIASVINRLRGDA